MPVQPLQTARFTTPDGLTLIGETAGTRGALNVVLLHGGGQTRRSWSGAVHDLAAAGYYVLSYDARGHGDSDWAPNGDYAIETLAADLVHILNGMSGSTALIGASLGGLTAFCAIGTIGRRIADALVLVDVVLRPSVAGTERIRAFMKGHPDGFATLDEAAAAVAAFNPSRQRAASPEGLQKILRKRPDGRWRWHWDPRMVDHQTPARADRLIAISSGVRVPVMLVHGGQSEVVNNLGIEEMERHVPQLERHEIKGAGHMIAGDHNAIFLQGVMSFLRRNLPTCYHQ